MTNSSFTESQIVGIKQQFSTIDHDGDGFITEKEFIEALKNANRNPDEYDSQQFFSTADKSRDGKINFNEFLEAYHKLGLGSESSVQAGGNRDEKHIDAIFRTFDRDGNGSISAAELKKAMAQQGENLSDKEIEQMIAAADKNADGAVDRQEFGKMV
ncbi:hypothetical protein BGZ83_005386 [Gryganskiella cystojenkinii]|nr:hypothetical protein BGZ83_005386 [Gryganskiella cystojenkinii]